MKKIILASSIALMGSTAAHAVDIKAGDWTVSVGGIINAYYTQVSCSGDTVGGLALGDQGLGCGGQNNRTTIGNGLLPSGLIVSAKGNQNGYDLGATIGIMTATASDSAIGNNSNVDVRQGFMTIGNASMGTIKLGRDYGIFGSNAILGDMTLMGAGSPNRATQENRVTLGHIGAGYSYLGTYGMIAYSMPASSGVKVDVALVSPVSGAAGFSSGSSPQVQGQVSFTQEALKIWVGGKGQRFEGVGSGTVVAPEDFTMAGGEIGASFTAGPAAFLANVQAGKGLGILADGDQGKTKSTNYFVQATYKVTPKTKVGLNYGMSKNRDENATTGNLESNANVTAGLYYSLTPSVTLVGELGQTRSKGFNGDSSRLSGGSVGGIFFF